jgi:putative heme transporter
MVLSVKGGLAVIVALGDGGPRQAVIMLVVVLVSNLALENFVEPKVMGAPLTSTRWWCSS